MALTQLDILSGKSDGYRISSDGGAFGHETHTLSDYLAVSDELAIMVSSSFPRTNNMYLALAFYTSSRQFISRPVMMYYEWDEGWIVPEIPENASYARLSCPTTEYGEAITLYSSGGGGSMSDSAITYTRGGRLAFTAGTLREHVGETCTLSFWIKLADGAVEGHDVIVYHYQNSGCAIAVGNYAIHPTSEWQLIEVSGNVVSLAPRDGSTYDGSSEFYLVNGTAYSYGEMWFYDRTASQKYDVYGIQLTLAGGGWLHAR